MKDALATIFCGVALVTLVGCGEVDADADATSETDAPETDAPDIDAPEIDAPLPRCNPAAPFGAPVPLTSINQPNTHDEGARLSRDELTMYFTTARAGGVGSFDVWRAVRTSTDAAFANPEIVPGINTADQERYPTLIDTGLYLYVSGVDANGMADVQFATRASTSVAFPTPSVVATVNGTGTDGDAYVLGDHSAMYFASDRTGAYDLYRSSRSGGAWSVPLPVPGVGINNPNDREVTPVVSPDELTIFFSSNRAGGAGNYDIWMATRATTADGFGTPVNLTNVNAATTEYANWISDDGCVLYLTRIGGVTNDLYDMFVATRGP